MQGLFLLVVLVECVLILLLKAKVFGMMYKINKFGMTLHEFYFDLLIQYLHIFIWIIQYYFRIYIYIYIYTPDLLCRVCNICQQYISIYVYVHIYRVFYAGSIAVCCSGMCTVIVRLRQICCPFCKEWV